VGFNKLKRITSQFKDIDIVSKIGTSVSAAPILQKSMFTVFRFSDDRVLLTIYPAELK